MIVHVAIVQLKNNSFRKGVNAMKDYSNTNSDDQNQQGSKGGQSSYNKNTPQQKDENQKSGDLSDLGEASEINEAPSMGSTDEYDQ